MTTPPNPTQQEQHLRREIERLLGEAYDVGHAEGHKRPSTYNWSPMVDEAMAAVNRWVNGLPPGNG